MSLKGGGGQGRRPSWGGVDIDMLRLQTGIEIYMYLM